MDSHSSEGVRVRTFSGGGFAENAYLVTCGETGAAVAVDPGGGAVQMADVIAEENCDLQAILLTHAHLDHVEGVHQVRATVPYVPIWLHPKDWRMYEALPQQAEAFGLRVSHQPPPDKEVEHGQHFTFGTCTLEVRFTPGHAPGHVIFVDHDSVHALVGDVVFQGSIGRTDLPGGDLYTLMRSIREEVLTLPDEMVLYPGHGPATTVGDERRGNPFLVPHFGGELA